MKRISKSCFYNFFMKRFWVFLVFPMNVISYECHVDFVKLFWRILKIYITIFLESYLLLKHASKILFHKSSFLSIIDLNQHIFTCVDRVHTLHAMHLPHKTWFHCVRRHQVVATARRCWCLWFCGWPHGRGHWDAGRGIWLVWLILWAELSWADYTVLVYLGYMPWYICCTYKQKTKHH